MDNKRRAIAMMLISAFGFSVMAIFVRLAGDVPAVQKSIFRTYTIMIISGIVFFRSDEKFSDIKNYKPLAIRVIFGTIGIILNYYAIDNLILSDANVIFRLSSIGVIILSVLFLGEKITALQIGMAALSFLGVILVSKPSFSVEFIPYLVAILGMIAASVAYTSLRAMKNSVPPRTIVFVFAAFSSIVLTPYVLFNFEPMPPMSWVYLILAGASAAVGQYGITLAYKYAPASQVSIYNYFGLVFTAALAFIFLDEAPEMSNLLGYIMIFTASYVLFRYSD